MKTVPLPGASFQWSSHWAIGDAGCFSFYPVKHLTTAEGGMIILKDDELAKKLRLLKAFGVNRSHGERKIPGDYGVIELGYNYRMSEVHAAIGFEQMKKLPSFLQKRKKISLPWKIRFTALRFRILPQPIDQTFTSSHYCMGILLESDLLNKRKEIMESLKALGLELVFTTHIQFLT